MIIIQDTTILQGKKVVATIGFFDGVHVGHRFLIEELKQIGKKIGLPTAVITFSNHPRSVLQSDYQPKLLNVAEEKLKQLETTGIDYCIVLNFTPDLAKQTAQTFISTVLAQQLQVDTLLIGYDHRFGHNREDGFEQYKQYGAEYGMKVLKASQYSEGEASISSSEIRRLLATGHVEKAAQLLTYPYQLKGHIVSGYKVGRKLGFPTANIQVDEPYKIIPNTGVYAVWVYVADKRYKGMLHIGNRPTLDNGDHITLEVNILDFNEDIYNNEITVAFIHHIRENVKFNSIEELIEQLKKDRETINQLLTKEN
ncbi:MAG: bifunctional riboflavin kinase/FAD synthetase [Parabacteroides sp.]|nr:bifunctional riboflavin kinase/FAD synthetase [Parabacteroides sp.]